METEAERRQHAEDDARFDRGERRHAAVMRILMPVVYVVGGMYLAVLLFGAGC